MRVVALACVLLTGCACTCDFESAVSARAGAGATDCGLVLLDADPGPSLDCVDAAIADGRAVRAGWQRMGIDSEVRTYLAGRDGSFSLFAYDGGVAPRGGCAHVSEQPCDTEPVRITDASGRQVFSCSTSRSIDICVN